MKEFLAILAEGKRLSAVQMERAVGCVMDGEATAAQVGAFLMGLRVRGETSDELVAAARAVRRRGISVSVEGPLVDTCGTGGDGLGTFNVSTAAALVAAAGGAKVAKHGNRAASGKVGAADVLEAAGVSLELEPERAARAIEEIGFAFLFAPRFHPAFKHVAIARREVGVRTLFNLVGPLCNPAGATRQLLGLADAAWMEGVAEALRDLGTEHAMIVHGSDGSDEITLTGPTDVVELRSGRLWRFRVDPAELGLSPCRPEDLAGGDALHNAERLRQVLRGQGAALGEVVAANAGAALYVAGQAPALADGVAAAREILADGSAEGVLDRYIALSNIST